MTFIEPRFVSVSKVKMRPRVSPVGRDQGKSRCQRSNH